MMRRAMNFFSIPFYRAPDYDENLAASRRTVRRDVSVLLRALGAIRGYGHWVAILILSNMAFRSLFVLAPMLDRVLFDTVIPAQRWDSFWVIVAIWLSIEFVQGPVLTLLSTSLQNWLNMRMGLWLQVQFYRHMQKLSPAQLERKGTGDHMYRMHGDAVGVVSLVGSFFGEFIGRVYEFMLFLFFMSVLDTHLFLIVLAYEALNLLFTQVFGTWLQRVEFYVKQSKGLADARMQEGLAGVETVKVYGRRKREVGAFVHRVAVQMRIEVLAQILESVKRMVLRYRGFFPYFKEILITWMLYWQVLEGDITYGLVAAVLAFLKINERPVEKMIDLWLKMRFRLVQCERVFQVWDCPPAVVERDEPHPIPSLKGKIAADALRFSYDNGVEVLHGVDLSLEPGTFAAIVGASGSGKSTLLSLLMRLYDPDSGRVTLDGIDVRELDSEQLRRRLGIVMQETFLSKESLRWNLMLGHQNADDSGMVDALARCRLEGWYRRLPNGLDSDLREGTRVSIGEKQRLGIARALLRNSPILLLDEPTSSLDLETEQEVMKVIHDVRQGRTAVMVTHRLSTIRNADVILAMRDGTIVESGTHDELMARQGEYRRLVDTYRAGPSRWSIEPSGPAGT